ncbi:hypothetical protein G6Z92_06560 [Vibrio aestuarianus subsp. cardii]|uniref:hypothetical protein n=1 Tax=Vibrio aestuarianus TaxID=28171 RepID=UPI0015C57BB9|nr:hypothetical protein [Vibrio aestuarianus]NGZ66648.1 hypothetical protein [Vibrio aestuarianus subsp. cardii]
MKQKKLLVLAASLSMLNGCDLVESMYNMVKNQTDSMTIYMSPNVKLQIDDEQVAFIQGFDECPDDADSMDNNNCIKIQPETDSIKVRIINDQVNLVETWDVSRSGDAVLLTRPNGFQVREPNQP